MAFLLCYLKKMLFCLLGKLVDETGEYKYMYLACGAIVLLAGVWLLIGNVINYRLLAKEKKLEGARRRIHKLESRESESLTKSKHSGGSGKSKRSRNNHSERETNI